MVSFARNSATILASAVGGGLWIGCTVVLGSSFIFVSKTEVDPNTNPLFTRELEAYKSKFPQQSIKVVLYQMQSTSPKTKSGYFCHKFFTSWTYRLLSRDSERNKAPLEEVDVPVDKTYNQFLLKDRNRDTEEIILSWASDQNNTKGSIYFKTFRSPVIHDSIPPPWQCQYGTVVATPEGESAPSLWWTNPLINRLCMLAAVIGLYEIR